MLLVNISLNALLDDLKALGLSEGDKVLVHTSLSKVGMVEGGPKGFVSAIAKTVGKSGLAVFPTLTGTPEDSASKPPYFDVRNSPCWTGKVPEAARVYPGAIRSLHPTHSVAVIGSKAKELVNGHEFSDTPCGEQSPYGILAKSGGKILLVGVNHDSNTTFHTAEEYAKSPFHMLELPALATIVDYSGEARKISVRLHHWGTERDFNLLEEQFIAKGIEKIGTIGKATCRLIESGPMIEIILEALRKDPYYLVVNGK